MIRFGILLREAQHKFEHIVRDLLVTRILPAYYLFLIPICSGVTRSDSMVYLFSIRSNCFSSKQIELVQSYVEKHYDGY